MKRTIAFLFVACSPVAGMAAVGTGEMEYFENHVRPLLIDRCYKCHSRESGKSKGGLLLDSLDGLLKGGESGPAIVPGDVAGSLLIKAVRYTDEDYQMPPDHAGGKLSDDNIRVLENWIRMGAPDPRIGPEPARAAVPAEARRHWAFQPLAATALPPVRDPSWIRTDVDRFILARLEASGLSPARPADKRTLLRRITYDLTGLPPSPEEMSSFLADDAEDAYARVVDRLLASPRYGEKWGRHWLDVARYADSKGYVNLSEPRRYAHAHTYRDYVIAAMNADKPIDRFLLEQIAADRLAPPGDNATLAALGFLTLGRRFQNKHTEIINDRIDVVTRGMLGLTVACARCHDHKYDPITTRDYYALYGVFSSSEEPDEKPLLTPLTHTLSYDQYKKKLADVDQRIGAREREEVTRFLDDHRAKSADYLLMAATIRDWSDAPAFEVRARVRGLNLTLLRRWGKFLDQHAAPVDPVFGLWNRLKALPEANWAVGSAAERDRWLSETAAAGRPANARIAALFAVAPSSLEQAAEFYGAAVSQVVKADAVIEPAAGHAVCPDNDSAEVEIRTAVFGPDGPSTLPYEEAYSLIQTRIKDKLIKLRQERASLEWTEPGAPARVMALFDKKNPANSHVQIRGNPDNLGAEVPRAFLEVLSDPTDLRPFNDGSGRRELGSRIVEHPLTARVFVNRVWGWHFGSALVRSPSDFGVRTEPPPQLDLLNWMTAKFRDDGWSLKALHRQIVLSNSYRQSSEEDEGARLRDPENLLVHHFERRRLDFEELRDTLLVLSGRIDYTAGGQADVISSRPFPRRRSVYAYIDRQNMDGVFRTFDFPSPDNTTAVRYQTTAPQQALFMMNSPFVQEQATHLAAREDVASIADESVRIVRLFEIALQRRPDPGELERIQAYLGGPMLEKPAAGAKSNAISKPEKPAAPVPAPMGRWEVLAQVMISLNEVAFLD